MSTARTVFTAVSVAIFTFGAGAWLGRHRADQVKAPQASTGLHVYLLDGGRLVHLCQSSKPIQQVVNCDDGQTILLPATVADNLVLSDREIGK